MKQPPVAAIVLVMSLIMGGNAIRGLTFGQNTNSTDWILDNEDEIINYHTMTNHISTNLVWDSSEIGIAWYGNEITNAAIETTNVWFAFGEANQNETIMSWDTGKITFFPGSSNEVSIIGEDGTFKVEYDCPVDEASKAVLDGIRQAGEVMGYLVITKEDAKVLAEALHRLQDWEKAAEEYRRLSRELK